ncbi:interferon-inducible GTPase 5-like [Salarias fasciatus]|uniref:interferon-inducible GTPase 5-like n=1 Tax=Salarias fasciatus TaxID=181472 RepID=UPI001176D7EC|nr:interferon-inducible GTPase 5-like [Salarias fasciatus]
MTPLVSPLSPEVLMLKKMMSKASSSSKSDVKITSVSAPIILSSRSPSNCGNGLHDQGLEAPQVFLVSSYELHDFDFHVLQETLERELPQHKRHAFVCALPNISKEIIKKKKDAYQAQIKYHALLSSGVAAALVPGFSVAVDLALVAGVVTHYVFGFGLNEKSLKRLSVSSGVPYSELVSVMMSKLGATTITPQLILKLLGQIPRVLALIAAEEVSRFFVVIGAPVSMILSGVSTYRILKFFLDLVADDAQRVFEKAVRKTTEV